MQYTKCAELCLVSNEEAAELAQAPQPLQSADARGWTTTDLVSITYSKDKPPYRKPMARNTTLFATSYQPPHVTRNMPVGELIRAKWNCTNPEVFTSEQERICSRLRKRNYPRWS